VQLIELEKIDTEIDSFASKEATINENLNKILEQEKKNIAVVADLEEAIADNKMKKSKSEAHLAELSAKLDDIAKKSNIIKNEKEMKSLQLEEEIAKEQVAYANEEIERLDRIEKAKEGEITTLKVENEALITQAQEARENTKKEIEALEQQKKACFENKQKLVGEVPQKILSFYQKIRRWAGNTTVVPVKKQSCYGCFMKINDRVYADVIKSEEITTCPSCGRILYIEHEEA
jgi:predicted  nucleic acid-binding Zn-ribbon protein